MSNRTYTQYPAEIKINGEKVSEESLASYYRHRDDCTLGLSSLIKKWADDLPWHDAYQTLYIQAERFSTSPRNNPAYLGYDSGWGRIQIKPVNVYASQVVMGKSGKPY